MIEILKYMTSGFWVFIGTFSILYIVLFFLINGINKLVARFFRMIMVICRGWSPKHLDADGDSIQILQSQTGS